MIMVMMVVMMAVMTLLPMLIIMIMVMLLLMIMVVLMMVVMIMFMVMFLLIIIVILSIIVAPLKLAYPSRRRSHTLKVKHTRIQYPVKVHIAKVAVYYLGTRLQSVYYLPYAVALALAHLRHLVEHHYIAKLQLLDYQVLYILIAYILTLQTLSAPELALKPQRVSHSHYAVQPRRSVAVHRLAHPRYSAYSLRYRLRLAYSACLYHYIVKLLLIYYLRQLLDQIHLQRAAYTTVLKRHQTIVLLIYNAALGYQVGIYVHLTYIVHYHRKLYTPTVIQNTVDKSGLSTAKIAREQQHRHLSSFHFLYEISILNYLRKITHFHTNPQPTPSALLSPFPLKNTRDARSGHPGYLLSLLRSNSLCRRQAQLVA